MIFDNWVRVTKCSLCAVNRGERESTAGQVDPGPMQERERTKTLQSPREPQRLFQNEFPSLQSVGLEVDLFRLFKKHAHFSDRFVLSIS